MVNVVREEHKWPSEDEALIRVKAWLDGRDYMGAWLGGAWLDGRVRWRDYMGSGYIEIYYI